MTWSRRLIARPVVTVNLPQVARIVGRLEDARETTDLLLRRSS